MPRFDEDVSTSMRLVCDWLMTHKDYLLVFDAADDVRILEELGKQRPNGLRYIPPRISLKGHVIVTARCPREAFDRVQIMQPIPLGDLTLEDTCAFLTKRIYYGDKLGPKEQEALKNLAEKHITGRLPLFVEQTATYIRGHNMSFREYLKEVTQNRERNPVDNPAFGDNRKCVDDAFKHSFDAVQDDSIEAAVMLNMAALCHSRNIPVSLFAVGAFVLSQDGCYRDEQIAQLMESVMENIDESAIDESRLFASLADTSVDTVSEIVNVPWRYHLLNRNRGGNDFTVHEVIQEQLRLRMKENKDLFNTLYTLGTILLYMLTSDDVVLATKRQFLAHAESCASHMHTFGLPLGEEHVFLELYLRLQIQIAYVFAWLGSFSTAWRLAEELDTRIPQGNYEHLKAEQVGMKARMCVWQHKPHEALTFGIEALRLMDAANGHFHPVEGSLRLNYAYVHKSCAHSLIMLYMCEGPDIKAHLTKAKMTLEYIMGMY